MGWGRGWLVCVSMVGCGPAVGDASAPGTTESSASASAEGTTADEPPDDTTLPSVTSATTEGTTTSTGSGSSDESSDASSSATAIACDPSVPVSCAGTNYGCADGEDNDLDGLVDLDDPECLNPCDDSEDALDEPNMHRLADCVPDCAFDGNSGIGDDGCFHRFDCDPLEPVPHCATDQGQCEVPPSDPECPAYCVPFTPNGCDCWGCCAVEVDGEPRNILVTYHSDCSFANLDACPECTPQMEECGNPCDVEACEICFGQQEPPVGCAAAGCGDATPCSDHCDCEAGEWCSQGCCRPPLPG